MANNLKRGLLIVTCTLVTVLIWAGIGLYGGLSGWWLSSVVSPDDDQAFGQWVMAQIEQEAPGSAAFAIIEAGEVTYRYASSGMDNDTLFATASMSKFIASLAVMTLVQDGKLKLDEPVSTYLSRWQLPDGAYDNNQVTIRRLLAHTSGLNDRLGFADYLPDEPIPSLEDSLANPRASSGREVQIKVEQPPGEFVYSGGGYLILELVVEEVSNMTFAEFVSERLFEPMLMKRSTYDFLGDQANRSESYFPDGSVAPTYQYASNAATGLSTSIADLERLVAGIDRDIARQIREPEAYVFGAPLYGLGAFLYAPTAAGDFVFGHDGGNEPAINSAVRINPDSWDAFVMLESGHLSLASDIGAEWVLWQTGYPDILSTERALASAVMPISIGCLVIIVLATVSFRRMKVG